MRRTFRKPLIVVAPKKLLRFKDACSDLEEFKEGLRFSRIIREKNPDLVSDNKVRRVIFCSGQVYYDLDAEGKKKHISDVAIVRIE